eukprot:441282_1
MLRHKMFRLWESMRLSKLRKLRLLLLVVLSIGTCLCMAIYLMDSPLKYSISVERNNISVPTPVAHENSPLKPSISIDQNDLSNRTQVANADFIQGTLIPKTIYQTWKTSPDKLGRLQSIAVGSWPDRNPGYTYEFIGPDPSMDHFVKQLVSEEEYGVYTRLPLPVMKADFFRYLALHARGGIYADIDVQVTRKVDSWVELSNTRNETRSQIKCIVGAESFISNEAEARRIGHFYPAQMCQWTIACAPGHPILRETLQRIYHTDPEFARNHPKVTRYAYLKSLNHRDVHERTGPWLWTRVISWYLENHSSSLQMLRDRLGNDLAGSVLIGDVLFLGERRFGFVGENNVNKFEFVHHQFLGSWKPDGND